MLRSSREFQERRQEQMEKQAKVDLVRSYIEWKKNPTKRKLGNVLRQLEPTINVELNSYKGQVADNTLKGMAKKIAISAIRSYKPSRQTALTTHVKSQMRRLHRVNYESANIRLPENLQQGIGGFLRAKDHLEAKLGREPTAAEIADELRWSIHKVTQLEKRLRNEVADTQLEFSPIHVEESPFGHKIDYFYNDLPVTDQLIFEHTTGYGGKKLLKKSIIAKQLGISPARVSQRVKRISNNLTRTLGV